MKIRELSANELAQRLGDQGLYLRTGPFTCCLKTRIRALVDAIGLLYADFPCLQHSPFADFHVSIARRRPVRRALQLHGSFEMDGARRFKPFPHRQAIAYLEWGLNRCIYRHGHSYLIVHAAVLAAEDGRAVLIVGAPGAGKSTLCAALALNGWRLLSDELALISPADGTLAPLARPVILKNESIRLIRDFDPNVHLGPVATDTPKGTVAHMRPPSASVAGADQPAWPTWLVFVNHQCDAPLQLEPIPKGPAMLGIAKASFNYGVLGRIGFDTLRAAVDAGSCYRLTYDRLEDAVELFSSEKFRDIGQGNLGQGNGEEKKLKEEETNEVALNETRR